MHVVALTGEDAPRYRALMLHAYEAAGDAFTSTAQERAAEPESWWVRRLANPECLTVVFGALEGEELVGTVTVEFSARTRTKHKAHLIGMFVAESARGMGVGKALLEAALDAARARRGVAVVTLTVTEGNVPATSLYRSFGLQVFGVEPMAISTPDGFRSKVHMWLPLQAAHGAG